MKVTLISTRWLIFLVLAALILTACSGTASQAPTQPPPTAVPATNTPPPPPPTNTPLPTATSQPTNTPLPTPTPTPEISSAVMDEMTVIQADIGQLRGLNGTDVTQEIMDPEEVGQFMLARLTKEYTDDEAFQDLVTLSYLGLISPTFDLRDFYTRLYEEQLLGLYDQEQDKMILITGGEFGPLERLTYAHEYTHALQDQAYDIDGKLKINDAACDTETERCMAVRSVLEGDASLASALWMMGHTNEEEQAQILAESSVPQPVLQSAPLVFQKEVLFPYEQGTNFVGSFYQAGGWEAVDALYANPPVTTEQILHPERYPDDLPVDVTLPDLAPVLGEGWVLLNEGTLGELDTQLLLSSGIDPEARLADEAAKAAAAGWDGDLFDVYFNPDTQQAVLVLKTQWDSAADASDFFAQLQEHVTQRFNLSESETALAEMFGAMQLGHAQFQLKDDTTYYILSPSEEISLAVLEAVVEK